ARLGSVLLLSSPSSRIPAGIFTKRRIPCRQPEWALGALERQMPRNAANFRAWSGCCGPVGRDRPRARIDRPGAAGSKGGREGKRMQVFAPEAVSRKEAAKSAAF